MSAKQWLLLFGLVLLMVGVLFFVIQGVSIKKSENPQGAWVCQDGVWAKFGETNDPRPVESCK